MKPKTNYKGDPGKSSKYDRCQTPAYAIEPIIPYLKPDQVIWEPACGEGNLVRAMKAHGLFVVGTDVLYGRNFFDWSPWWFDVLVTNPPYSIKYPWLERCYDLGKPFALLLPVETLGAARAQRLFDKHGVHVILLSQRVNFKMPDKGYDGHGAQFPVMWVMWEPGMGKHIEFATINNKGER